MVVKPPGKLKAVASKICACVKKGYASLSLSVCFECFATDSTEYRKVLKSSLDFIEMNFHIRN